jgi:hypothetical protein
MAINALPKAQQMRTVIISLDDLEDVHDALELLQSGQGLTAGESGLVAEEAIGNLTLLAPPNVVFDGFKWNVFIFVTSS